LNDIQTEIAKALELIDDVEKMNADEFEMKYGGKK